MTSKARLRIEQPASALVLQRPFSPAWVLKLHQRQPALTFGEFVMAVYEVWDKRRARGFGWLAVNARLVEIRGQRVLISERSLEESAVVAVKTTFPSRR